ncbi:MAG: hypothetical protein LUH63_15095 [Parabacteroides sp.]|nr:hypothetical protein [Parabacteroides sp.]
MKAAAPFPNIHIEANPTEERMSELIHEAQVHALVTFQATGLKLKLLNILFAGRHTMVNSLMVAGSGLEQLCHIADTPDEMIRTCRKLMNAEISPEVIGFRRSILSPTYSNQYQGKQLYKMIYEK